VKTIQGIYSTVDNNTLNSDTDLVINSYTQDYQQVSAILDRRTNSRRPKWQRLLELTWARRTPSWL
jgi:hypothetical protein